MSVEALEDMLYHRAGLLGISGISADPRDLLTSDVPAAREAVALFCFRIAREVAAIATTLGGLDGLVFTGGIGEHLPAIRAMVCARLAWIGIAVDPEANARNAGRIDAGGRIAVLAMATDEAQVIARDAAETLGLRD